MTKPTDGIPYWSTNLTLDPVTNAPSKTQPTPAFQSSGLVKGEPLYRGHFNWQMDSLARWLEHFDNQSKTEDFTADDLTPSVATQLGVYSFTNYTTPVTITDLEDSIVGQKVELFNPSASTITLTHGTNFIISAGGDATLATNQSITLRKAATFWYQV